MVQNFNKSSKTSFCFLLDLELGKFYTPETSQLLGKVLKNMLIRVLATVSNALSLQSILLIRTNLWHPLTVCLDNTLSHFLPPFAFGVF